MKKEQIEKLKAWVNTLTAYDFEYITAPYVTGYNTNKNRIKAKEITQRTGLKFISEPPAGEYCLLDREGYFCLVVMTKKGCKIIEKLVPRSKFSNFCWGFYAIPDLC